MKSIHPTSKPGSAIARQDPSVTAVKKSLRGPGVNSKPSEEPLVPAISLPEKVPEWSSTGADGYRVVSLPEGGYETRASVLCSLATCPQSGKVSLRLWIPRHPCNNKSKTVFDLFENKV